MCNDKKWRNFNDDFPKHLPFDICRGILRIKDNEGNLATIVYSMIYDNLADLFQINPWKMLVRLKKANTLYYFIQKIQCKQKIGKDSNMSPYHDLCIRHHEKDLKIEWRKFSEDFPSHFPFNIKNMILHLRDDEGRDGTLVYDRDADDQFDLIMILPYKMRCKLKVCLYYILEVVYDNGRQLQTGNNFSSTTCYQDNIG